VRETQTVTDHVIATVRIPIRTSFYIHLHSVSSSMGIAFAGVFHCFISHRIRWHLWSIFSWIYLPKSWTQTRINEFYNFVFDPLSRQAYTQAGIEDLD